MSSKDDNKSGILDWVKPGDKTGSFKREPSVFRDTISNEPGSMFPAEKGRYHLYVSYACPWAHRVLIVRALKGLEAIIPYTSVHWHMGDKGWRFAEQGEDVSGQNVTPDPLPGHESYTHLRDIYFGNDKDYNGRFTVPTLYDKKQKRIVNNESSEIIRMLYHSFDDLVDEDRYKSVELLPKDLETQIDEINGWMYDDINNGVYKSGFATTQKAYEDNVRALFKALDRAEAALANNGGGPYYLGKHLTEVDVRLYTTIIRFDVVYVQHFKCNIRDIRSGYPHLHEWLRNLYWNHPQAFKDTTDFEHIKKHYTKSHKQINPPSITPVGPEPDILPLNEEVAAVSA